jgi:hypothetical protein
MGRAIDKRYIALLAAMLGALAVFLLDIFTPPQVAAWTLYVLPLFALMWWGKKRDVYVTAAICAGLVLVGYYVSPPEQRLAFALTNRLLQVAVILIFAIAMGRRIDSRRELLRQHSRVKRLLDERNAAFEHLMAQHKHSEQEKAELSRQLAAATPAAAYAGWPLPSVQPEAASQPTPQITR